MAIIAFESATVAYTDQGTYINPQTGQVYGTTPPAGGWVAPGDPSYRAGINQSTGAPSYGQPVLPVGVPTTSNSNVSVSSAAPPPSGTPTSTTANASSNAPIASSTVTNSGSLQNLFSQLSNPVFQLGGFGVTPLILIAVGLGAFMLMGDEGHRR